MAFREQSPLHGARSSEFINHPLGLVRGTSLPGPKAQRELLPTEAQDRQPTSRHLPILSLSPVPPSLGRAQHDTLRPPTSSVH